MREVKYAQLSDLEPIVAIDQQVIGHSNRRGEIEKAIREQACLIIKEGKATGFLLFNTRFFENAFVSLIIIAPEERRKGYASSLLKYFEKISPTEKIFSSTNQSNIEMQKVFQKNGYTPSGKIENLDPGDPELIYFKYKENQ
ncbi:acetyltransferase (GNAT) family protein [Bacillus sp. V-88]|uniref:GNAT family N-acetyltransferase n=1 Tax=Rossellomorea vietnamensis TaxID=218284 RepID=UPI00054EC704|nr:GNAT family N-acetyltransferase [Rossellomorea vietnamensis]OXS60078.1 N-acetyltransferase [Bacillus sp. DSM 27956]PRX76269.1 acetyltransferase (GNAT) family protein [Bacillus sp. V-88]SLK22675.1 Acetyltransferase (GNAT) family protein [Bacillus sp. V-88]